MRVHPSPRRASLLAGLLAALFVAPLSADDPPRALVGKKIPNVRLRDADNRATSLFDLKGTKATVVVFLSSDCPIATSYSQPLSDMAEEFGKLGIRFIGLTTNVDETPAQVAKFAKDFNLKFPVFLDHGLAVANALEADITPEVFLLDADFVLRYRGRIDNSYWARLKKNQQITTNDLLQALGEIASGRPVRTPSTEAIGCPIPREVKAVAKAGKVTYHKDVLPILQNHCQQCHRPGEVGPFALMNYKQAVNWAADIKEFTQTRRMPPWKPAEGGPFHNERKLSDAELAILAAWADGGTPEGDPRDAPPPRKFTEGWQLGKPDLILTVPEDYQLGPAGNDVFRCFVLPTGLTEDKQVAAVEVRPGNARIVHHALLFTDTTGTGRKFEKQERENPKKVQGPHAPNPLDKGPGYSSAMGVGFIPTGALGGWAPGQMPRYLPEGTGILLPKNSDVVMQLHYHRNGRLEKDRTSIGIYFARGKVERPYQGGVLSGGYSFVIPAGEENFKLKGGLFASEDLTLYSVMPHMHMIGKEIKVTMKPPQGEKQTLLNIREWDYNWQETYFFKEPVPVKAGSFLEVEAVYDNSRKNPNNPFDPPKRITFGEQTDNEMCFVFLGGLSARSGQSLPLSLFAPRPPAKADDKK